MEIFPITILGDTLGKRHRHLNALVNDVFTSSVNFQELHTIQEHSPVDRLFKIDLALKLRNIDYVIQNLKDDDMLYVSRALKCKWLLENKYQNIMNPEYLEQNLYPHMITTAVSKMKCWISINLKDPDRCQFFHKYYSEKNVDLAIKFLIHCHTTYILNEIPKILEKLDPFYLKVFCEKSPQVAKIFFNSFSTNEKVLDLYLKKEVEYYKSLKVVLKADGNIFLDIIEKYFNKNIFKRLNRVGTKYIINNYNDRFIKKNELYAAWLLDIKSMAKCLTAGDCKDLTLKLARADYLRQWFTYQNVEPLVKRLSYKERFAFKNKVFVDKNIEERVIGWQYETPSRPIKENKTSLFDDVIQSDCYNKVCRRGIATGHTTHAKRTLLDQLFDEFRCSSFERTLYTLRKRIVMESSPQNREFMLLVLVSKTGGRVGSVASLLKLLTRHQNEPPHVRATIVRSLVKRAFVWRLPQESWESLMTFAVGLGLDGKVPEANCHEGLHAVVLRNLLNTGCIEECIFSALLKRAFCTFKIYSLTEIEKKAITEWLPALLLGSIINENNTDKQANLFILLFQVLEDYKLPVNICPVIPALAALVNRNFAAGRNVILKLFKNKIARRELFEQNFAYVSTDASYLNALRHSTELLKRSEYVVRALRLDRYISPTRVGYSRTRVGYSRIRVAYSRREQFFRKLAIYFTETNGLADLYLHAVKESLFNESKVELTRLFAFLIGSSLEPYLKELETNENKVARRITATLKANAHLVRPKLNIKTFDYHAIGPKAVANIVLVCRDVDIENYLAILMKRPRTLRMALILSERLKMEVQTFAVTANIRPNVTLKCGLKYIYRYQDTFNHDVWEIIKPIMKGLNLKSTTKNYLLKLQEYRKIPESIRPEYCTILYTVIEKADQNALPLLHQIKKFLPQVSDEFAEDFLDRFALSESSLMQVFKSEILRTIDKLLYIRILIKFLLLSKSEETQKKRCQRYAEPILRLMQSEHRDIKFYIYFKEVVRTLRYNAVFFNQEYVSCLPVFERIISWMHSFCPMEKCFKYYVEIQLTMLFFKSVRQCLKHNPNIFDDGKKKFQSGIDMLGKTFGVYIAKEVEELKSSYFDSIVELYRKVLVDYLNVYFPYDSLKVKFRINIIRGIIEYGHKTTALLAVYLFKQMKYSISKDSEVGKEIKANLCKKDIQEMQFFWKC